ncbi:MAG: hypothetical protein IPI35_27785 [Deltaproteobacteria bacterium]|nr:hypothetical protein [Deltaproteobacteria bacterium]
MRRGRPLREPVSFESSIIRIRLDVRRCLPDFLFEWLRSPLGSAAMGRIVTFTTVAGIKGSDLARLMVPIPSLAQQQAVIESLRTYV